MRSVNRHSDQCPVRHAHSLTQSQQTERRGVSSGVRRGIIGDAGIPLSDSEHAPHEKNRRSSLQPEIPLVKCTFLKISNQSAQTRVEHQIDQTTDVNTAAHCTSISHVTQNTVAVSPAGTAAGPLRASPPPPASEPPPPRPAGRQRRRPPAGRARASPTPRAAAHAPPRPRAWG